MEVLGSIWDQTREWKVLFERVEHRSGQWERPATPAPDETKAARGRHSRVRHPLRTNTPSKNLESRSDQDRARPLTRAQFEDMKMAFRATSSSGVTNPLQMGIDLVERGRFEDVK